MTITKLMKALFATCLSVMLVSQVGCWPSALTPTDGTTDQTNNSDNNGADQETPAPAGSQTPVLTVTSLLSDITVAQGQPVLLTWQIQNLPGTPTLDIVYRATTEQTDKVLIGGLETSSVGSLQIDTYSLVPGLKYIITLNLKSAGTSVNTAQAAGRIAIGAPKLTLNSPLNDAVLLPSSLLTIKWTGLYLPADSSIQTFLDTDTTYSNGNEVIVKTDSFPTGGSQGSGSITLNGSTLWNNADVKRSLPYYLGVRLVKNGQISIASYASATVKLYGGEGFNLTSPANNDSIRPGDSVNVRWTTSGVPSALKVKVFLTDRDSGGEIAMPGIFTVTSGGTIINTLNLAINHSFDTMVKLLENDTIIAIRKSGGAITTTTEGSSIFVNNIELNALNSVVYLGLENTYTITWETVDTPVNSKVSLFLDEDGNRTTTADQIEITPVGGVDATLKTFDLTPTAATFTGFTGRKYFVFANLISTGGDLYAQSNVSEGKIRIGDGGIQFTAPVDDVDLLMGDTTNITWVNTGDICAKFAGSQKTIRLFVDENPGYLADRSREITPVGGLDTCAVQTFTFDPSKLTPALMGNTKYYLIARLRVAGITEDETQVVATGQVSVSEVILTVLTPTIDVTTGFDNINVTWEIEGLNTTNKKVRIYAVAPTDTQLADWRPISVLLNADANAGVANASKLPSGTYTLRCEVFGYDANGDEISFDIGDAGGQIVIPSEYVGIYQLADMAAATDPEIRYSPIDGAIFEGENIGDLAGYGLGSLGDVDGDGFDDFLICSRYGKVNNTVKPGAIYLIYGKSDFAKLESLSNVAASASSKCIDGTLISLPMENAAMDLGGGVYTGDFKITSIPNASKDGLVDLMVTCPTAMPLIFKFTNKDPDASVKFVDYYGTTRTLAPNQSITEISHVFPWFRMSGPEDDPARQIDRAFRYGQEYFPGNTIDVQFDKDLVSGHTWTIIDPDPADAANFINIRDQRGTCYLLTSERLKKYRNKLFNMVLVGSPVETDNLVGVETDQMYSWGGIGDNYGIDISVLPPLDFGNKPELIISGSTIDVIDAADVPMTTRTGAGLATIFNSEFRGTSYNSDGGWQWWWGDVSPLGYGRLWRSGSMGSGLLGDPTNGIPHSLQVDVIGPANDAALTSVSGLTGNSPWSIGGDFNGNGVFDILIGTPGENGGNGAMYVLNLPRFLYNYTIPQLDLANFDTPYDPSADPNFQISVLGVKITGNANDNLGKQTKAIGDFNGDGLADFVIALPDRDSSGGTLAAGRVMIVFGKEKLPSPLTLGIDDLTSSAVGSNRINALIFEGANANDKIGEKICAVYDVNADGFDDLLIASPNADHNGNADCGKIYLIYGRGNIIKFTNKNTLNEKTFVDYDQNGVADTIRSIDTIGTTLSGAVFVGEAAGDKLQTMSFAGDVNGDGINDFLIGAPYVDSSNGGPVNSGKAYLILGRPFTWPNP